MTIDKAKVIVPGILAAHFKPEFLAAVCALGDAEYARVAYERAVQWARMTTFVPYSEVFPEE